MSTNPEPRADDALVTLLSQWLARHVDDDELRAAVADVDADALTEEQAAAVAELRAELAGGDAARGDLEMAVRETLEALALGGS
jgi:hypothetical protein